MAQITRNTKLPFGKNKGKSLKQCDDGYIKWVSENLKGGDFDQWAIAAGIELKMRESEDAAQQDLEKQADEFLRKHNIDPNNL